MEATLTGSLHTSLDITIYIKCYLFLFRVIHDKLTISGEAFGTDVEVLGARIIIERDGGAAKIVGGYIGIPMESTTIVGGIGKSALGIVGLVVTMHLAVTVIIRYASFVLKHVGRALWALPVGITLNIHIDI